MSDHNGACSSLFGGSCDCQATLPRHWLATTDGPTSLGSDATASQGAPVAAPTFASNYSRSPYDPNPPKLDPAQNGWIYCNSCDSVVEAAGHECRVWGEAEIAEVAKRADLLVRYFGTNDWVERAEFAESLLNALAFDHQQEIRREWLTCGRALCVYCDAARKP